MTIIIEGLATSADQTDDFRVIALSHLAQANAENSVEIAAKILMDDNDGGVALDVHAGNSLNFMRMFNVLDEKENALIKQALHDALDDERDEVEAAALRVLVASKDKKAVTQLVDQLQGREKRVLKLSSTIYAKVRSAAVGSLLFHDKGFSKTPWS